MLYYAQIYIHLSYGISAWGSMITKEQLNKLSKIQRKAISLLKLNPEVEQIMDEEKILNLDQIIQTELLKIRHHLSTNTLPVNLAKNQMYDHLLKCLQQSHNYNTRNNNDLKLPNAKVKTYGDSFLYKSMSEYNKMSHHLKTITNL